MKKIYKCIAEKQVLRPSRAILTSKEQLDNEGVADSTKARSAQARIHLLGLISPKNSRPHRANRYAAQAVAEVLHEDSPITSILKENRQRALAEFSIELATPEILEEAESAACDTLSIAYDRIAFEMAPSHTSHHPNPKRIEKLSARLSDLSRQLDFLKYAAPRERRQPLGRYLPSEFTGQLYALEKKRTWSKCYAIFEIQLAVQVEADTIQGEGDWGIRK